MVRNETEARHALKEGRAVRLEIENVEASRQALYLIPCNGIENEDRIGILICAEGRGAYFYDGYSPLKVINLVQSGFMPLDASRAVNALKQIFPETETLKAAPKQTGNPQTLQIENQRHEYPETNSRKPRPTGAAKRKSARKSACKSSRSAKPRSSPPPARGTGVRRSGARRSGSGKAG